MAKRRMIDPSIWDDPDVGELSDAAFRLFIGIFSNADDDGRLSADPRWLKKIVFGYRSDVALQDVAQLLEEIITKLDSVRAYQVGGKAYLELAQWKKYQTIAKDKYVPSRLPAPCALDTEGHPEGIPQDTEGQPDGSLGKVKLKENRVEDAPLPPDPTPFAFSQLDDLFEKFWEVYPARNGHKKGPKDDIKTRFSKVPAKEWPLLVTAAKNYATYCQEADEYPVDPIRFFGSRDAPSGLWREYRAPVKVAAKNGTHPPVDISRTEMPQAGQSWDRNKDGTWRPMERDPVTGKLPFGLETMAQVRERNKQEEARYLANLREEAVGRA